MKDTVDTKSNMLIDKIDIITLQNGGTIMLDKLAYESLQGCTNIYDYHTHEWTTTVEFKSDKINTAIENTEIYQLMKC